MKGCKGFYGLSVVEAWFGSIGEIDCSLNRLQLVSSTTPNFNEALERVFIVY